MHAVSERIRGRSRTRQVSRSRGIFDPRALPSALRRQGRQFESAWGHFTGPMATGRPPRYSPHMSAKPSRTPSIVVGVIAVVAFASAFFVIVSNGDHVPWAIEYTLQTVGFLALVGSLILGRPAARARKAAGRGAIGSARPGARPNVDDWTSDPD